MIPVWGHYALILAFCLALLQAGLIFPPDKFVGLGRRLAVGQCFFVTCALLGLAYAFISNDFSLIYVAENSSRELPWVYRFCAIWGAHKGSLLLWVWILSLWMALVSYYDRNLPEVFLSRVLAVLAIIAVGFYVLLLGPSDPFQQVQGLVPTQGADLNPILQDPGLVIHPPILYLGYVGLAVPFAFAISALLNSTHNVSVWLSHCQPWVRLAWCFLTLGILLGSWWSYRELGWGGFWFWDPVENASLLPWLTTTALLHGLVMSKKRGVCYQWTVLLAIIGFALSLLGTFLVRSGVLISVHAFALNPAQGQYLLLFLVLIIGGALLLYAWRGCCSIQQESVPLLSREVLLLSNTIILFIAMCTVLLGTLYPLVLSVLQLGKISVGAPYFNEIFGPLILLVMVLMGFVPTVYAWKAGELGHRIREIVNYKNSGIFILSLLISGVVPWVMGRNFSWWVFVSLGLSLWVIASTVCAFRVIKRWGMVLAHVGFLVMVIGVVVASVYTVQKNVNLAVGESVQLAGYRFTFSAMQVVPGPNYTGYRAMIAVKQQGRVVKKLYPELRKFNQSQLVIPKTAIDEGVFRDLYIALGRYLGNGRYAFRLYDKPLINWIWFGGFLMLLGGLWFIVRMVLSKLQTKATSG